MVKLYQNKKYLLNQIGSKGIFYLPFMDNKRKGEGRKMCTAISYQSKDHYFGRTMDYEISFGEKVVVTPRNYPLKFRLVSDLDNHYSMIGMAAVADGYPLYFDATNERGLSMAGLNFPGNAVYFPKVLGKDNIAPFELIPWILGQCSDVIQANNLLKRINLTQIHFSQEFPLSPLHWIIADQWRSITVESVSTGLKIYENEIGVLTNNPSFDIQLFNLNNYMALSAKQPSNYFSDLIKLQHYSRGMGGLGLPGDNSSSSRFVRAAFTKHNSVVCEDEKGNVGQFFHVLGTVSQVRGCVELDDGAYVVTRYTSCCNTNRGIYYYTTYDNSRICGVDLNRCDLQSENLISFPLQKEQDIWMANAPQAL